MKKIAIIILILIIIVGSCIYFRWRNVDTGLPPRPKLTADKIINDQVVIDSIVLKRISPSGNHVENVMLESQNPDMKDGGWKDVFYVCSQNENQGWIRVNSGFKSTLYGPYDWCLQ